MTPTVRQTATIAQASRYGYDDDGPEFSIGTVVIILIFVGIGIMEWRWEKERKKWRDKNKKD